MIAEAKEFAPYETGGVFMGYRVRDSVIITNVIGSGPKAVHKLKSYRPDTDHEQHAIAAIYEESHRMYSYLGDWHTHPSGILRLSGKDKKALAAIAKDKEARVEHPIMAILAGEGDDWRFHVWKFHGRVLSIFVLRLHSTKLRLY